MEWDTEVQNNINIGVAKGIIIVEAAGNGIITWMIPSTNKDLAEIMIRALLW